jgi:hypothetical protein
MRTLIIHFAYRELGRHRPSYDYGQIHTPTSPRKNNAFSKARRGKYHGAVLRKNIDRPKILFDLLISKNPDLFRAYLVLALLLSLTISFFNLRVAAFLFASILGMISLDLY